MADDKAQSGYRAEREALTHNAEIRWSQEIPGPLLKIKLPLTKSCVRHQDVMTEMCTVISL